MRYMLVLLVLVLGLEGVDRALLERAMESMNPPRAPNALQSMLDPPKVPVPPPPPPPGAGIEGTL